jgi:hypothetical protein
MPKIGYTEYEYKLYIGENKNEESWNIFISYLKKLKEKRCFRSVHTHPKISSFVSFEDEVIAIQTKLIFSDRINFINVCKPLVFNPNFILFNNEPKSGIAFSRYCQKHNLLYKTKVDSQLLLWKHLSNRTLCLIEYYTTDMVAARKNIIMFKSKQDKDNFDEALSATIKDI